MFEKPARAPEVRFVLDSEQLLMVEVPVTVKLNPLKSRFAPLLTFKVLKVRFISKTQGNGVVEELIFTIPEAGIPLGVQFAETFQLDETDPFHVLVCAWNSAIE
jgi:hypothetical protein